MCTTNFKQAAVLYTTGRKPWKFEHIIASHCAAKMKSHDTRSGCGTLRSRVFNIFLSSSKVGGNLDMEVIVLDLRLKSGAGDSNLEQR